MQTEINIFVVVHCVVVHCRVGLFLITSWTLIWKSFMIKSEITINPSVWTYSLPEKCLLVQKGQWKKGSEAGEQLYRFLRAVFLAAVWAAEALPPLPQPTVDVRLAPPCSTSSSSSSSLSLCRARCWARDGHQQAGTRQCGSSACLKVRQSPRGKAAEMICCLLYNLSMFTHFLPSLIHMLYLRCPTCFGFTTEQQLTGTSF